MYLIQLHINQFSHDRFQGNKEIFSTILPDLSSAKEFCRDNEYDRDYSDRDRVWSIKELGSSELIQVSDDPVLYEVKYPEKTIYEETKPAEMECDTTSS